MGLCLDRSVFLGMYVDFCVGDPAERNKLALVLIFM